MTRFTLPALLAAWLFAGAVAAQDAKITELPAASAVSADDLTIVVDDPSGTPATKKATAAQVATFVESQLDYDIAFMAESTPEANAVLLRYVFPRAATFADDFAGSKAIAALAATASTVLTVKKNGSTVGTITFAIAGTTGTFATSGGSVSFAADDILTVVAPASPDATAGDFAVTFVGTRS